MQEGRDGALITDEQLLALVASAGSLSAALEHGDVTLVHDDRPSEWSSEDRGARRKRLADYRPPSSSSATGRPTTARSTPSTGTAASTSSSRSAWPSA